MPVGELQQRMTVPELSLWGAFYRWEAARQAEADQAALSRMGRR